MVNQGVAGHLLSVVTALCLALLPGDTQREALQTPHGGTDSSKSSGLWMLDLFQGW